MMDLKTNYDDFVTIEGRVANPLNIASNQEKDKKPRSPKGSDKYPVPSKEQNTFIPVSDLKHLPSPKKNKCKFNKKIQVMFSQKRSKLLPKFF